MARNELRQQGYLVIRSAGSKTPVDLVAVGQNDVRLIQVKRVMGDKLPSFGTEIAAFAALPVPACCVRELWVFVEGRKAWVIVPV